MVKLVATTIGTGEFEFRKAEELIVAEARVSSNRDDLFKSPEKLLRYMITKGHWSPFDMADLTFHIECELAIAVQLLRHWTIKPQQYSQRYADNPWQPFKPVMRMKGSTNRQSSLHAAGDDIQRIADESIERSFMAYQELLSKGVAPECARFVLPTSSRTKMYYKGSIRSFITFLNQRLHHTAQLEIRVIAEAIKQEFLQQLPIISATLNNFKGAETFHILDQVIIMSNLDNIEKIKKLWNEPAATT